MEISKSKVKQKDKQSFSPHHTGATLVWDTDIKNGVYKTRAAKWQCTRTEYFLGKQDMLGDIEITSKITTKNKYILIHTIHK